MIAWPKGSLSQNVTSIGRLPVMDYICGCMLFIKKQGIVKKG
ncbi:hypothetical protein QSI_1058 [Clostridioides difficile P28]|jgi:hypothetical protein|nr:hypothetical protein QSI_1058 [Clostridioides difficile P28]